MRICRAPGKCYGLACRIFAKCMKLDALVAKESAMSGKRPGNANRK